MHSTETFLDDCFVLDMVTSEYIPFQLMPEEISHSKSVNWNDQEVMGRFAPLSGYSNSGPRSISLTLQFARDLGISFLSQQNSERDVLTIQNWFMSFGYPSTQTGLLAPPHPVYVRIANMIQMKGRIGDVQVSWRPPWYYPEGIGVFCEVQFSVTEIGGRNVSLEQVRRGEYTDVSVKGSSVGARTAGRMS